ncbi:unnamed protein product [Effrenium voratum]|nr:unnamed protein product [Effrenium voratum]
MGMGDRSREAFHEVLYKELLAEPGARSYGQRYGRHPLAPIRKEAPRRSAQSAEHSRDDECRGAARCTEAAAEFSRRVTLRAAQIRKAARCSLLESLEVTLPQAFPDPQPAPLADPAPQAPRALQALPHHVLLGASLWLPPSDFTRLAAACSLIPRSHEMCCWNLQIFGLDPDELRRVWSRKELSAQHLLLFALRRHRAQQRARHQGIAAGLQHFLALREGTAFRWTKASRPAPLALPIPVRMVACGGDHSLLVTVDGQLWSCGRNDAGQLGLGHRDADASELQRLHLPRPALQAACGADHSLVLLASGEVWGFGRGSEGQLGSGEEALDPIRVATGASHIACGADHSVYLDCCGRAFSFGENSSGQLGLGHCCRAEGPTEMILPRLAVDVDCGGTHTLILVDDLTVFGCGNNDKGQLGEAGGFVPELLDLGPAEGISCGFSHSLVLSAGSVRVLGGNSLPRPLGLKSRISEISAGGQSLCASSTACYSFAAVDTENQAG